MSDKIFHLIEDDGKSRLIQAQNETAALLYAVGAKFQIKAANAVETVQLMGQGVTLEVAPDTRTTRKPRGKKAAEQAATTVTEEAAPNQENWLDSQQEQNSDTEEDKPSTAEQAPEEQPTE